MIREALFNIIGDMTEKTFLDLFAGTGSVGIEALSRGCSRAVFVEKNFVMAEQIQYQISNLGFEENTLVLAMDFRKGVARLESSLQGVFDFIFIDPPYQRHLIDETLSQISSAGLAGRETLIAVQHSKHENPGIGAAGFIVADQRTYGDSRLTFIRKDI